MVRAHPTVPAFHSAELSLEPELPFDCRDTCAVARRPPVLANPDPSPTIPPNFGLGGWMTIFQSRTFSGWITAAGHGAVGFDLARRRPELHPRTGAGLHRRRVPALQFRDSRCRPRDGLHGRQEVPALAALPRAVQAGSRAQRGRGQAGRPADRDPACNAAQGRERQGAQGQKAGETRDLTAACAISRSPLRDRLTPCGALIQ